VVAGRVEGRRQASSDLAAPLQQAGRRGIDLRLSGDIAAKQWQQTIVQRPAGRNAFVRASCRELFQTISEDHTMTRHLRLLLGAAAALATFQASAQVRLYEHDRFAGRSVDVARSTGDLSRLGFNDLASSAIVRGGKWTLCEHARFGGHCVTLRPGRYPSLSAMGLNDRVSSVRHADERPRR
jgi:hypothetical protein